MILAIPILLRPLGRRIDRQPADEDSEIETIYRLRATTRDKKEAHIRALLLQSISGHGYQLRALESANIDGTDQVEVRAELAIIGRHDEQIEAAAGRLGLETNVTSVRWQLIEHDGGWSKEGGSVSTWATCPSPMERPSSLPRPSAPTWRWCAMDGSPMLYTLLNGFTDRQ